MLPTNRTVGNTLLQVLGQSISGGDNDESEDLARQALAFCGLWLSSCAGWRPAQAQVPKYEIDPTWPKPLPGLMVTGRAGGICVDAQDHVFEVNRGDLQDKEKLVATPAPPVLEYDSDGNLVNTFGDFKTAPASIHGCIVDKENNIYVAGNDDAVVQKYTHDGSKMLLQIGTKGLFDTSTGLITGIAMNRSKSLLNKPADIAVDPGNGDIYIADGYGDHRIAVFDKDGNTCASLASKPPRTNPRPGTAASSWAWCTAW